MSLISALSIPLRQKFVIVNDVEVGAGAPPLPNRWTTTPPPRTATATSATIAPEFLEPGANARGEVLARERSGNQTITEIPPFAVR